MTSLTTGAAETLAIAPEAADRAKGRSVDRSMLERWLLVFAAWAIVCVYLVATDGGRMTATLGDSDDAMRLVMVRELAHGRGWYDQLIWRVQPPYGFWPHWSRLLDGVLAALVDALTPFLGGARAEWWVRLLWPLCLIGPAIAAGLALAARLSGEAVTRRAAVIAAAVICVLSLPLYAQFHPGRVDHHNVQILCWLIAFAAACDDGRGLRGPVVAGAATGIGLAIGFETIVLLMTITTFMGVRFVVQPNQARRLRAYGIALSTVLAVAFLAQTPPVRWAASSCDGLGLNVVAGLGVGALGLTLATLRARGSALERLALVAGAGVASIVVCVVIDPSCLHGPFGEFDPRIHAIWADYVQELEPMPRLLQSDFPTALTLLCAMAVGPAAWVALGATRSFRTRPAYWLNGAMIGIAAILTFAMMRMGSYLMWATLPTIATLAAVVVQRLGGAKLDPARLAAVAALSAPSVLAAMPIAAMRIAPHREAASAPVVASHCLDGAAYADLARLPAGLVAANTDLGPYVLAHTPSTTLAAPYHADFGIIAAHRLLAAPAAGAQADGAERIAHELGVTYVVVCPAYDAQTAGPAFAAASLRTALDAGHPPAWLKRLSPSATSPLQVFAVEPPR
jgi:hypothetical protein